MSCEIKIGKFEITQEQKANAMAAVQGVTDFDIAVMKSYEGVKNDIPLAAWEKYLREQQEIKPKTRSITEEDLFKGQSYEDVTTLKNLLNGELMGITPEADLALGQWKKHLIDRNKQLSSAEVGRVLNSLKALVEMSKRESQLDKMRTASAKRIRKGHFESFPIFSKLLGIKSNVIKNFEGNPEDYSKAEMLEDYRAILEVLSAKGPVLEISNEQMKDITAKANAIVNAIGTAPSTIQISLLDSLEDKGVLIEKLLGMEINPQALVLRKEREIARKMKTLTAADLEALSNEEILIMIKGINSINEGLLQHEAQVPFKKVLKNRLTRLQVKTLMATEKLDWLNFWSRGYGKLFSQWNKGNMFEVLFRSRNDTYSGTIVGDKHNTLYREVYSEMAVADEQATGEKDGLFARNANVDDLIGEINRTEKIYTTSILSFMNQHESNENQYSAEELVDQFIANGIQADNINHETVALMKEIKAKYIGKDGKFDRVKLEAAVKANKGMTALLQFNADNNKDVAEKLLHTTATERGEAVPVVNNASPIQVLWDGTKAVDPTEQFARSMHPGAKSSAARGVVREGKAVPVVEFDLLSATTRTTAEIITDYYVTPTLKMAYETSQAALAQIVADGGTKLQINAAKGWAGYLKREIDGYIANHSETDPFFDKVAKQALKASYTSKLLRAEKVVSELVGNVAWWGLENPVAWIKGAGSKALHRTDLDLVFQNIGTIQQSKLGKGATWAGKGIDKTWLQNSQTKRARATKFGTAVEGGKAVGKVLGKPANGLDAVASFLLSGPDKWATRPGQIGVFETEFKKRTGMNLGTAEYDLISANDEAFMAKHGIALRESMTIADETTVRAASTSNSLASATKFKKSGNDPGLKKFYKVASGYLMSFAVNEGAAWKYYMRGIAGREEISRGKAVRGAAGVLVRMALYRPIMTGFGIFMAYLAGDDEDEDEDWKEKILDEFTRDLLGSFLTLSLQGTHGGWERQPFAMLTEYINEEYLGEILRDGEDYDRWKHGLSFLLLRQKEKYGTSFADIAFRFAGPLESIRKDWESAFKAEGNDEELFDELTVEMILIVAAYTGHLPAYRDIVNYRKKDKYNNTPSKKGSRKREKRTSSKRKRE